MASNREKMKWASDAFKKAQNLMSPGYNKESDFTGYTTVANDDVKNLARTMGFGGADWEDNMQSQANYFNLDDTKSQEENVTISPYVSPEGTTPIDQTIVPNYNQPSGLNVRGVRVEDPSMMKDGSLSPEYYGNKIKDWGEWLYENTIQRGNDNYDRLKWLADNKKAEGEILPPLTAQVHNNAGNLEVGQNWNGETKETYGDGRFATFNTAESGLRALRKDLTKKLKDKKGSLLEMIKKYAPEKDGNDVKAYLETVQLYAGKKGRYGSKDLPNIVRGFIAAENTKELKEYYFKILDRKKWNSSKDSYN
jgi:hypothetical protein